MSSGSLTSRLRSVPLALAAVFACGGPESSESRPPTPSPIASIAFDVSAAFAILDVALAPEAPNPRGLLETAPILADAVGLHTEEVLAALRGKEEGGALRFEDLRDPARNGKRRELLRGVIAALAVRRGAIEAAASRHLPSDTPNTTLHVFACFGLAVGEVARPVVTPHGRGLVLDLDAVAARGGDSSAHAPDRDRLGEELARILAPELFIAGYERLEAARCRDVPHGDLERFRRALLVLGIADHLSRKPEERFDDQGRRRPEFDVAARSALSRFERNLTRVLDPLLPEVEQDALRFSFAADDLTTDAKWGVIAGSAMIDAIDRFAPHGRIRAIVDDGPKALARAYAEVCSGHAAIPRLSIETISLLSR